MGFDWTLTHSKLKLNNDKTSTDHIFTQGFELYIFYPTLSLWETCNHTPVKLTGDDLKQRVASHSSTFESLGFHTHICWPSNTRDLFAPFLSPVCEDPISIPAWLISFSLKISGSPCRELICQKRWSSKGRVFWNRGANRSNKWPWADCSMRSHFPTHLHLYCRMYKGIITRHSGSCTPSSGISVAWRLLWLKWKCHSGRGLWKHFQTFCFSIATLVAALHLQGFQ